MSQKTIQNWDGMSRDNKQQNRFEKIFHFGNLLYLVLCARTYVLAFQEQTPSQSEIFFQICYCRLFSLLVCMYWPSRTKHPPKVKYFFKSVIVACSLCLYECIGLPGPNTLPKWNIFGSWRWRPLYVTAEVVFKFKATMKPLLSYVDLEGEGHCMWLTAQMVLKFKVTIKAVLSYVDLEGEGHCIWSLRWSWSSRPFFQDRLIASFKHSVLILE